MNHTLRLAQFTTAPARRLRRAVAAGMGTISALLAACGGGEVNEDIRREPLAVTATSAAPVYDRDDLYRFFAIAFGAAPGVTLSLIHI